jgi:hypothetical protein
MMLRVGASDGCARQTQDVYWLSQMSLHPVLTAARVALHRGACSRGDTIWSREGWLPSLCEWVRLSVFGCVLCTLPMLGIVFSCLSPPLRVPSSPFIVCKGRGRVTVSGCTKIERKGPKVLPIARFHLYSCIRTVIIAMEACHGCR